MIGKHLLIFDQHSMAATMESLIESKQTFSKTNESSGEVAHYLTPSVHRSYHG